MKRNKDLVQWQDTRVIRSRERSGESSPYWEWANKQVNEEGEVHESPLANPDLLSESSAVFKPESGISVGDISRQLSGHQKKVFKMYVQEGKSEADIARVLGIGKRTVETYLLRIRREFKYHV